MKYIELKLDSKNIKPHVEIKGYITVNFSGRYDGVVVNTHSDFRFKQSNCLQVI